jgi:hypothetical protein
LLAGEFLGLAPARQRVGRRRSFYKGAVSLGLAPSLSSKASQMRAAEPFKPGFLSSQSLPSPKTQTKAVIVKTVIVFLSIQFLFRFSALRLPGVSEVIRLILHDAM